MFFNSAGSQLITITFPIGLKLYFSQNKFCKISLPFNKLTITLKAFFLSSILFAFNNDNNLFKPLSLKFKNISFLCLSPLLNKFKN